MRRLGTACQLGISNPYVNFIFYGIHVNVLKMDVLVNIFVILLSFLCLSSGLYFHIGETEKKCFIEDIPDDTMVVGKAAFAFG